MKDQTLSKVYDTVIEKWKIKKNKKKKLWFGNLVKSVFYVFFNMVLDARMKQRLRDSFFKKYWPNFYSGETLDFPERTNMKESIKKLAITELKAAIKYKTATFPYFKPHRLKCFFKIIDKSLQDIVEALIIYSADNWYGKSTEFLKELAQNIAKQYKYQCRKKFRGRRRIRRKA